MSILVHDLFLIPFKSQRQLEFSLCWHDLPLMGFIIWRAVLKPQPSTGHLRINSVSVWINVRSVSMWWWHTHANAHTRSIHHQDQDDTAKWLWKKSLEVNTPLFVPAISTSTAAFLKSKALDVLNSWHLSNVYANTKIRQGFLLTLLVCMYYCWQQSVCTSSWSKVTVKTFQILQKHQITIQH